MSQELPKIEQNLQISLKNASWLTPADTGAIATAVRLARLIDGLFDSSDVQALAPLLARFGVLLGQLKLVPDAREEVKEVTQDDQLGAIIGGALRLVSSSDTVKPAKGSKPRASSRTIS